MKLCFGVKNVLTNRFSIIDNKTKIISICLRYIEIKFKKVNAYFKYV